MANQGENNTKLGVFVTIGLLALIFSFYMIGKNRSLFGANFKLKVHFANTNGLIVGDNVLFSGIQAGTVKNIAIVNDSSIEVLLTIDNKVKPYIHKNAIVSIGTEGLMGEKVVNISPGRGSSPLANEGDLLANREAVNTDALLQTLSKTNDNIAFISDALKTTVSRLNSSAIWDVLNDRELAPGIRATLNNISRASTNANEMSRGLNDLVMQIKHGKGAAGTLLTDTTLAANLKQAVLKIRSASDNADKLTVELNNMVTGIKADIGNKNGSFHVLLKDSTFAKNLAKSMDNIQKGTDGFNQDMEALKHNFLLRGYFKKLEKQQKKAEAKN